MSLETGYAMVIVNQDKKIKEQADEIERLREALKRVELRSGETHIVDLAHSALQQNGSE